MTLVTFIFILFIILLPTNVMAKSKHNLTKERAFDDTANVFSDKNLNSTKKIFNAYLNKLSSFRKSEYESTDEFGSRIENLCDRTLVDEIKFCDTVGFQILKRNEWPNENIFVYDADAQELILSINNTYSDASSATVTDQFVVSRRAYSASNAYNKKVKVIETIYDNYILETDLPYRQTYKISMTPHEAKEMKKWGAVILIGDLEYPFIGYKERHYEPTTSDPYDAKYRIHSIKVKTSELWVVNRKTGKIYLKDIKEDPIAEE